MPPEDPSRPPPSPPPPGATAVPTRYLAEEREAGTEAQHRRGEGKSSSAGWVENMIAMPSQMVAKAVMGGCWC